MRQHSWSGIAYVNMLAMSAKQAIAKRTFKKCDVSEALNTLEKSYNIDNIVGSF